MLSMISTSTTNERPTSRELTAGLLGGEAWAERELLERYTRHVERVVARITGDTSADLDDRVQEVFVRVVGRLASLRDPDSLPGFVTQIAVFVAREAIRARRRRRWLAFLAPADLPETEAPVASDEIRGALDAFYELVERLDPDPRIVFLLRHVEGMELAEVASACDVSLATVKRRLSEAEREFKARAAAVPELEPWLAGRSKWARVN
jgi:RNA polymerase sigma-70 factor (ECF subfamily)